MYENRGFDETPTPLTPEELRSLQAGADEIGAEARSYLSDAFSIESSVVSTPAGPKAAVSVHPPDGPPVAAGFSIDELDAFAGDGHRMAAVDLVATAVDRAKSTVGDRFVQAGQ